MFIIYIMSLKLVFFIAGYEEGGVTTSMVVFGNIELQMKRR